MIVTPPSTNIMTLSNGPLPPTAPAPGAVNAAQIPSELRVVPHWASWHYVHIPGRDKPSKVPINPRTGRWAKPNDSSTWGAFEDALKRMVNEGHDGIGFLFQQNLGYAGIDLDEVVTPDGIDVHAQAILDRFPTYTEPSVSGEGYHLIVRYTEPLSGWKKLGKYENYWDRHFFVVTGHALPGRSTIHDCTQELLAWRAELTQSPTRPRISVPRLPATASPAPGLTEADLAIIKKCRVLSPDFGRLYDHGDLSRYDNDASRADQGLLGYFTKAGEAHPDALDRLYRSSALMREKWEREDYAQRTISRALDGTIVPGRSTLSVEERLQRENAALSEKIARQEDLLRRNGDMMHNLACILRNPSLKTVAKVAHALAIAFAHHEGNAAERPYPITINHIASATGLNRNTASKHVKRLQEAGLLTTHKMRISQHVDPETGEIVPFRTPTWMAPVGSAMDFAHAAAIVDLPIHWGGHKKNCFGKASAIDAGSHAFEHDIPSRTGNDVDEGASEYLASDGSALQPPLSLVDRVRRSDRSLPSHAPLLFLQAG